MERLVGDMGTIDTVVAMLVCGVEKGWEAGLQSVTWGLCGLYWWVGCRQ